MTTLRRELKQKVLDTLNENIDHVEMVCTMDVLSEYIADAVLEVAGIAKRVIPDVKPDYVDAVIKYQLHPRSIQEAIAQYFKLTPNWEAKYNRQFMEWAVEIKMEPEQIRVAADVYRTDKRFNWQPPSLKLIQEHWLELVEVKSEPERPEWRPYVKPDESKFVPYPGKSVRAVPESGKPADDAA